MFDNYEKFKKDVYALTKIDLNYYKEKQMRRRIDTIATKHGSETYQTAWKKSACVECSLFDRR